MRRICRTASAFVVGALKQFSCALQRGSRRMYGHSLYSPSSVLAVGSSRWAARYRWRPRSRLEPFLPSLAFFPCLRCFLSRELGLPVAFAVACLFETPTVACSTLSLQPNTFPHHYLDHRIAYIAHEGPVSATRFGTDSHRVASEHEASRTAIESSPAHVGWSTRYQQGIARRLTTYNAS